MSDRLLLLACPLLVALSLIACSDAEVPADESAATVAVADAEPAKPTYNAIASEPVIVDNGVRLLLDTPLIDGLALPFDYSLIERGSTTTGPITIMKAEIEVFGANEAEAVAQLDSNLQAEGFKLLNNKGTQGKLIRSYARGGRSVFEGADTVDVVADAYPGDKTPQNPAAKARLRISVSTKQG